jgi:alpha-tubulin suppressor-like RCC1 family protein
MGPGGAQPNQVTPLVASINRVAGVVAAQMSTCVIQADVGSMSQLRCFGANEHGQLGVSNAGMGTCGAIVPRACTSTPGLVPGIDAIAVSGGESHMCAIVSLHDVYCWGHNSDGQLGEADPNFGAPVAVGGNTSTPQKLLLSKRAVAIASGSAHNCLIDTDGQVSCWGKNDEGQLGDGTTTSHATLSIVPGIVNASAIVAAGGHTCALLDDGTVKCWGSNQLGQLGLGTNSGPGGCGTNNTACSKLPVLVPGVTGGTAIASSTSALSTCVALINRKVTCWGVNGDGQLGRGTLTLFEATPGLMIGP